jgi:hypothetical protein
VATAELSHGDGTDSGFLRTGRHDNTTNNSTTDYTTTYHYTTTHHP